MGDQPENPVENAHEREQQQQPAQETEQMMSEKRS